MRVLVTGGAGFIGSAVCRQLIEHYGASVIVMDCLTYASNLRSLEPVAKRPGFHFVRVDIRNHDDVTAAFERYEPDAVIHLAAETHVDRSITGSAAFVETNVIGTYNLLEASRRYLDGADRSRRDRFRFVHVSTDEVYGSLDASGQFSEMSRYDPTSPYSASKAASDHIALAWFRTYGLPVVVSHCSNNYGPYQFPEKLIPLTILNALEGQQLRVYGDGSHVRDWLHVDDHARGLISLLSSGKAGERYNFGGASERSNLDVVVRICDLLDALGPPAGSRRSLIRFVADRPGHDKRYAIDASKARNELGWAPTVTFEDGLVETVRWYVENRAWWQPLRSKVYDGSRLGLLEAARGG